MKSAFVDFFKSTPKGFARPAWVNTFIESLKRQANKAATGAVAAAAGAAAATDAIATTGAESHAGIPPTPASDALATDARADT
eukprot:11172069-Lingulodinium_polyedra.AAC.1